MFSATEHQFSPDIARRRTHNIVEIYTLQSFNQEPIINCSVTLCPCGFTNNLASHLERSPLIHSYGYDYYGRPALALWARLRITSFNSPFGPHFVRSNLLQANLSADDRPTWLLVSSMRLTPNGASAKNLSRRFFARLSLNPKSFMQYPG